MGMYDTIVIKMDTGFIPDESFEYQTKDLGSNLDYYEIRDDGTLWKIKGLGKKEQLPEQQIIDDYIHSIGVYDGDKYFTLNMWFKSGIIQSFDDGEEKYHLTQWGKNNTEVITWLEEFRTPHIHYEYEQTVDDKIISDIILRQMTWYILNKPAFPDFINTKPLDSPPGQVFYLNQIK